MPTEDSWVSDSAFEKDSSIIYSVVNDLTQFKNYKVGLYYVPLSFINTDSKCIPLKTTGDPNSIGVRYLINYLKNCSDKYSVVKGMTFDRSVGFSNTSNPRAGFTLIYYDMIWVSRFNRDFTRKGVLAHEVGHTFGLCDEYNYTFYVNQNLMLNGINYPNIGPLSCKNDYPSNCPLGICDLGEPNCLTVGGYNFCKGSTDISSLSFSNFMTCSNPIKYDIMGLDYLACGFDQKSYDAVNPLVSTHILYR